MAVIEKCRSCGAPIVWAKSAKSGKAMPVDAEPVADGNLVLIEGVAHVQAGEGAPFYDHPRHKSHFATCPQAGQWRKR